MGPNRFDRPGASQSLSYLAGGLLVALVSVVGLAEPARAATTHTPTVSIVPSANGGRFNDGQVLRVSVGPNSLFVPHSRVVIIECADPGGDASHLPISLGTCDENTVQGDTTVVQADGSFTEPSYTMFALPNKALSEQPNAQPACNTSNQCVLFVGEDQNDFTKPKVFSVAFSVAPGTGSTTPVAATPTPGPPAASVDAAVSLSPTSLAFTGPQEWLTPMVGAGGFLILLGLVAARVARRSAR